MSTIRHRPLRAATAALVISALAWTASSSTAEAAPPKVLVEIDVAVKIDVGVSPVEVAAAVGASDHDALIGSRNVHRLTMIVETKATDDPAKFDKEMEKAEEWAVKHAAKDKRVVWAINAVDDAAHEDRFHAWPATDPSSATAADLVGQAAFADLDLDAVHDLATGTGTIVAVLDTGVDALHPLLVDRVLPGYDMVDDDADPSEVADGVDQDADGVVDSAYGHGTFVAGVVAQVAPDSQVIPVRVLDSEGRGDLHEVIEGIEFAVEQGADVINLSFGLESDVESDQLEKTVKAAQKAGSIVVAAAGNAGDDRRNAPASVKDVISVTALDASNINVAHYATRGRWVTIAAPGHDVVSAVPGGGYARWAGTSMATPVVAGGVTLLIEADPSRSNKKHTELLIKRTHKLIRKEWSRSGSLSLLDALS